jgi:hypothetical protein
MTGGRDRARDASGRPQSDRPRDAEGRPLPHDAPAGLAVPREPEDVVRTPAESIARARELLAAGQPFNAHDVLEAAWKQGPPEERDLWQGLAQLCVALTHVRRGNPAGARTLFARGASRLRDHAASGLPSHGVDVGHVATWAESAAATPEDADLPSDGLVLVVPL